MRKWPLILLIIAVLGIGGRFIYGIVHQPDDKAEIRAALADAIKASREGKSGSVVDKLAANFKVNGSEQNMGQIADIVRKSRPEVTIKDTDPVINGDTAQITSDVTVKADLPGFSQTGTFKDAELMFKKQNSMEWLIFPSTKWVLSDVRVAPDQLPQLGE